jgi:type I restriction enzyme M protein
MIKKTEMLDVSMMENWLWDAACTLRGPTDAPKYKDFILPLIFYKRLSDVFDDEFESYIQQFGDKEVAHMVVQNDHYDALKNNRKTDGSLLYPN